MFRTPIGFHDAYVAAPSRKAALAAWGSDADLFARGIAEEVTDETLTREPLATPGQVIKRSRGTVADNLAALPSTPRASRARKHPTASSTSGASERPVATKRGATPKPKPARPRPSRASLDKAEAALAALIAEQETERDALDQRERALRRERQLLEQRQRRERAAAERKADAARERHAAALDRWIADQA